MTDIVAMIVGIEAYDQPTWNVNGPRENAMRIVEFLRSIGAEAKDITLLANDGRPAPLDEDEKCAREDEKRDFEQRTGVHIVDPTKSNIANCFAELPRPREGGAARARPPGSRLFIYWCGHGYTSRGARILICRDFRSGAFIDRVINAENRLRWLGTLPDFYCFSEQIFIADVCARNIKEIGDDFAVPAGQLRARQVGAFATQEGAYSNSGFSKAVIEWLQDNPAWPDQSTFLGDLCRKFENTEVKPFIFSGFNEAAKIAGRRFGGADRDKAPSILRLCVTPFGMPSPRPVNLLMALGVNRIAAIAVTIGIDAAGLAEDFMAVESMVQRVEGEPYVTRTWDVGPPASWGVDGARGAVWEVAGGTSAEEIWRALATAFSRSQDGCGNVLVITLPSGAQARAHALVEMCIKARAAGGPSTIGASVPVYLWRSGAPDAGAAEPLLGRIRSCVEAGVCADRSTDVQAVFRMRLHGATALAPEWDSANGEQIRLHDLSVSSANANQPSLLDEMRAADLIARVQRNQNLLYAMPFLPVSQMLLSALTSAPVLTRAVAGLLTPAEIKTRRPAWRRPMADGYRPAPALASSLEAPP